MFVICSWTCSVGVSWLGVLGTVAVVGVVDLGGEAPLYIY